MDLTRREMIKMSAAGFAAAALNISLPTTSAANEEIVVDKWIKGTCRFCGTGCGIYAGVRNGQLAALKVLRATLACIIRTG
jgi:nitrate reductase NapA